MAGFVDEAVLEVRGGRGGDGAVSLHREKYKPKGGPDGGDGGRGGDVLLEVSSDVYDLAELARHPHRRAGKGGHGAGNRRSGADGADEVLLVPDGTRAEDPHGLLADLVGEGARAVVARGGRGGRGNASLATSRNRTPRTAERGQPGEEVRLRLELRLVADVGLVGLPNAGKSTLLSKLTAAKPKVADYPFTTITPNLGVADGEQRFVLADVPGLIEGAHRGKGLGDRFLRHVTRCRALAYVVDLSAQDPSADLEQVRAEVMAFDPELAERPSIIAGTKADLLTPEEADPRADRLRALGETVVVSAVTGEGLEMLGKRLGHLAALGAAREERRPFVVLRPGREPFSVRRADDGFRVEGPLVERWVAETNFDDPASVARLQDRLRKEGVERKLAEAGAGRGDEVSIADRTFEYLPDESDEARS